MIHRCRRRRACFESACLDAAPWPSRFNTRRLACERRGLDFRDVPRCPFLYARSALRLVRSDVCPLRGGLRSMPALRAFDNPIAMACFVERAPCLPSRI
jgi:hypothetical protein